MIKKIERIKSGEANLMTSLNTMFGEAFGEPEIYLSRRPSEEYLEKLLRDENFIALVALTDGGEVVGGITAYVLHKYEQERSEVFVYDLAVREHYRRQGIALALIEELKVISKNKGAYLIVIGADKGEEDIPANTLYSKLGVQEDVYLYDIKVND